LGGGRRRVEGERGQAVLRTEHCAKQETLVSKPPVARRVSGKHACTYICTGQTNKRNKQYIHTYWRDIYIHIHIHTYTYIYIYIITIRSIVLVKSCISFSFSVATSTFSDSLPHVCSLIVPASAVFVSLPHVLSSFARRSRHFLCFATACVFVVSLSHVFSLFGSLPLVLRVAAFQRVVFVKEKQISSPPSPSTSSPPSPLPIISTIIFSIIIITAVIIILSNFRLKQSFRIRVENLSGHFIHLSCTTQWASRKAKREALETAMGCQPVACGSTKRPSVRARRQVGGKGCLGTIVPGPLAIRGGATGKILVGVVSPRIWMNPGSSSRPP
jgi:hypothetical protein